MTYTIIAGIARPVSEEVFDGNILRMDPVVEIKIVTQYRTDTCIPSVSETDREIIKKTNSVSIRLVYLNKHKHNV